MGDAALGTGPAVLVVAAMVSSLSGGLERRRRSYD
jgi:hypothetical protein